MGGNGNSILLIHKPAFCYSARYIRPPLGHLYLGATLREHGFPVRIFDLQNARASWTQIEEQIEQSQNALVGMGCDTDNFHWVLRRSEQLLIRYPHVRIIIGGAHAGYIEDSYIAERRMTVRGEGEMPMVMIADHYFNGCGSLADIPGLTFRSNGVLWRNPEDLGEAVSVDDIPFPDYSLLDGPEDYLFSVITARGCPYRCYFCSEGKAVRGFRPRSIDNIERELISLRDFAKGDLPFITFVDDTFTASPRRVREICDALDRVFPDKSRFGFFCEGRVNVLAKYPDLIFRLKAAGMVRLQLGIETGDQRMLDRINKKTRVEEIEKVIRVAREADVLMLHGVFICGFPGQTEEDIQRELEFAKHIVDLAGGLIELTMVPLSMLPGTEFRIHAEKYGLRLLDDEFATGRLLEGCFSENSALSKADIERLCSMFNTETNRYILEKSSYLTPLRIKQFFAMAADHHIATWLVKGLSQTPHVDAILGLRGFQDHRFFFELPEDSVLDSTPLSFGRSRIRRGDGHWTINEGSPFEFTINPEEYAFLEYFNAKLTFREIGKRVASRQGKPEEWGVQECVRIYSECEDKLAAIIVV